MSSELENCSIWVENYNYVRSTISDSHGYGGERLLRSETEV